MANTQLPDKQMQSISQGPTGTYVSQPAPSSANGHSPTLFGHLPSFLIVTLAVVFVAVVFTAQSSQSPIPDHGDWWNEMGYITAAKNFVDFGFERLYWTPTCDHGHVLGLKPMYFSDGRWPVGPPLIAGLLFKANWPLIFIRLVPLLVATLSVVVFYLFLKVVFQESQTPLVAAVALVVLPPFWLLSDNLLYFAYDFLFTSLFYLFIASATVAESRASRRFLAAGLLVAFLEAAAIGYEPAFAMLSFSALFPLLFGKEQLRHRFRRALLYNLLVVLAFALAVCTRFAHLAVIQGGLAHAIQNVMDQARLRSVGLEGVEHPFPGHRLYLIELAQRAVVYMPVHIFVILIGLCTEGLRHLPANKLKLILVLGLSETSYFVVMKQHVWVHSFTLYHMVFTVALLTAVALMALIARINAVSASPFRTAAGKCGTGLLVGAFALLAILCGPLWSIPNLDLKKDWAQWIQESNRIAAAIPEEAVLVVTVAPYDPSYPFFVGRPFVHRGVWSCPELGSIDAGGRPVFVLAQSSDPQTDALRNQFECRGVFLKGKQSLELFRVTSP
jgi:hypothetical protein